MATILRELKLDENHDLAFDNGQWVLLEGADAVAQRVEVRLKTFLGEWIFDQNKGTAWFQSILGRDPRLSLIRSIIFKRIVETQGVDRVLELDLDYDRGTRGLTVTGRIQSIDGGAADINVEIGP